MSAACRSSHELACTEQVRCWCREGELNPQGAKHRRILSRRNVHPKPLFLLRFQGVRLCTPLRSVTFGNVLNRPDGHNSGTRSWGEPLR